jgi:hypothetical protein
MVIQGTQATTDVGKVNGHTRDPSKTNRDKQVSPQTASLCWCSPANSSARVFSTSKASQSTAPANPEKTKEQRGQVQAILSQNLSILKVQRRKQLLFT